MKIGYTGIDLPEGKVKFDDKRLNALAEKDNPKKISPYFAEFICDEFVHAEVIALLKSNILDLLILDMEKIEVRMNRSTDDSEKGLLERCLEKLEQEIPLYEVNFSDAEKVVLKEISPHSYKPVLKLNGDEDVNTIIEMALDAAGYMFFYTSGPTESHAWRVKKNSDIVTCAGAIHSDLARGFIKGDVVAFEDYFQYHNFKDCIAKGAAKMVDRDYIVQPGEIIEIRFNV
ncbi:MAG: DUF933 domain-containing protein [Deferribacteres bacterium]|nr:DUF933 domain-containing protein [candidate division KSB1 bacterium]MCB9502047.1 DUF933 domain-containing protein [Deferribacteres bacterium]